MLFIFFDIYINIFVHCCQSWEPCSGVAFFFPVLCFVYNNITYSFDKLKIMIICTYCGVGVQGIGVRNIWTASNKKWIQLKKSIDENEVLYWDFIFRNWNLAWSCSKGQNGTLGNGTWWMGLPLKTKCFFIHGILLLILDRKFKASGKCWQG